MMRRSPPTLIAVAAAAIAAHIYQPQPVAASSSPTTVRVSISSASAQANAPVWLRGISSDGRYVLMTSKASTLTTRDTNGVEDVFVRDTANATTMRVSVSSAGRQANGASTANAISGDGRFVLFTSKATNLSVAKDTNGVSDVFLRDRKLGITRRVSLTPAGKQFRWDSSGVAVSSDGRYVLFGRGGRAYLRDRLKKTTTGIGRKYWSHWEVFGLGLSGNGRMVAYQVYGPKSEISWMCILDRAIGRRIFSHENVYSIPVSFTPSGSEAVFAYGGFYDGTVTVWHRSDGTTTELANGNDPQLTSAGTQVAFTSGDATLVPGDTNNSDDLFIRDLTTSTTTRVDLTSSDGQINKGVNGGTISGDDRWIAFSSKSGTVVPGDTNGATDVFIRGPLPTPPGS